MQRRLLAKFARKRPQRLWAEETMMPPLPSLIGAAARTTDSV